MSTPSQTLCVALKIDNELNQYVGLAVMAALDPIVDALPDSEASAMLRLEIIHQDATCQTQLADACVEIRTRDDDMQFVAPAPDAIANYISYWDRPRAAAEGDSWSPMSPGQKTRGHEVILVGQTLPAKLHAGFGGGYLHYGGNRPGDGWTVAVGIYHPAGATQLSGQPLYVTVTARLYVGGTNTSETLTL